MKKLLRVLLISATLALTNVAVRAQQSTKVFRIGVLTQRPTLPPGLVSGLRDLGYMVGETLVIEHRSATADSNRLPQLAEELVALKVDVIVAQSPPAIASVIKATKKIPIVMIEAGGAVTRGFVQSLALPGSNVTGLDSALYDAASKSMELIRELLPKASRIILLLTDDGRRYGNYFAAAGPLDIKAEVVHASTANELKDAYPMISKLAPHALITPRNFLTLRYMRQIAEFTIKYRLPWMSESSEFVGAGGLISYGANYNNSGQRAAILVDKVLKGANPSQMPVEPNELELVVNLKTARAIGVKIPPHILLEANRVIK